MTRLVNAKNVVLSMCHLLINMTNRVKLLYYRVNTKYEKCELNNIYNKFKQDRLYGIIMCNFK